VDALLAFAAALVTLRLSGDLVRRYRRRRAPSSRPGRRGSRAYLVAARLCGRRCGMERCRSGSIHLQSGALLTAALLGVGSLLLVGKRWIKPIALVYVGLAVGVALAVPLQATIAGTEIPDAQDVLDLWPARVLAITGNSLGTLAVVSVALVTFRSRPLGNALILAGIAVAGIGSGLAGLGIGALAPAIVVAAFLLYAGFVAPATLPKPHRDDHRQHRQSDERLDDRSRNPAVRD
jgi:hypothetical protein